MLARSMDGLKKASSSMEATESLDGCHMRLPASERGCRPPRPPWAAAWDGATKRIAAESVAIHRSVSVLLMEVEVGGKSARERSARQCFVTAQIAKSVPCKRTLAREARQQCRNLFAISGSLAVFQRALSTDGAKAALVELI